MSNILGHICFSRPKCISI